MRLPLPTLLPHLARLGLGLLLAASLAGCIDANIDVAVTPQGTVKETLTQVMRADSYAMLVLHDEMKQAEHAGLVQAAANAEKAIAAAKARNESTQGIIPVALPPDYQPLAPQFCPTGILLKRTDGGATCVNELEVGLDARAIPLRDAPVTLNPAGPGLTRITLAIAPLRQKLDFARGLVADNPDMQATAEALITGRRITVRFSGGEIVDSNMKVAKDGLSATSEIAIADLINGSDELPQELYAVIKTR